MNSMEDIQTAIARLSAGERTALIAWLQEWSPDRDAVREPAAKYEVSHQDRLLTVEEYLALEEKSDVRHEYVDGRIFAMSGASVNHNRICRNLINTISSRLAGGPCEAFMLDLKVHLKVNRAEIFYYPDIAVVCDSHDMKTNHVQNPKLVIEILSPSTETIDRREKAFNYKQIEALEEYVLVAQSVPQVTIYRRSENWTARQFPALEDVTELRSIGLPVALTNIYGGVFAERHTDRKSVV